ncbi:tyrosine-type recombinase/integrase [Paraburkholderia sediminicola]|uniref:tyrosine-type recombinase/integrase n=1 Tax=Paraburkholderia sediminicola TaxID=458836 RepID=UPI0038B7B81E
MTRSAVALACRNARQRSGIQKPITPHSLRHYVPFRIMSGGTDELQQLTEIAGHQRYVLKR